MSWIATGVLALIVGLIVWVEMRCGRRNKVFHQKLDPQVDALKNSVLTKYRERFGKDPTSEFPLVDVPNGRHVSGAKKA
jgi:uncharacterized membrane-anchored protein YhcB (DUF1043 family)